jgi:hypothetical protein
VAAFWFLSFPSLEPRAGGSDPAFCAPVRASGSGQRLAAPRAKFGRGGSVAGLDRSVCAPARAEVGLSSAEGSRNRDDSRGISPASPQPPRGSHEASQAREFAPFVAAGAGAQTGGSEGVHGGATRAAFGRDGGVAGLESVDSCGGAAV